MFGLSTRKCNSFLLFSFIFYEVITINGYIKTYNWAQQNEVERRIRNLGLPVRFTDNGVSNGRTYEITNIDNHIHMGEWTHLETIFGGSLEMYVGSYDLAE